MHINNYFELTCDVEVKVILSVNCGILATLMFTEISTKIHDTYFQVKVTKARSNTFKIWFTGRTQTYLHGNPSMTGRYERRGSCAAHDSVNSTISACSVLLIPLAQLKTCDIGSYVNVTFVRVNRWWAWSERCEIHFIRYLKFLTFYGNFALENFGNTSNYLNLYPRLHVLTSHLSSFKYKIK